MNASNASHSSAISTLVAPPRSWPPPASPAPSRGRAGATGDRNATGGAAGEVGVADGDAELMAGSRARGSVEGAELLGDERADAGDDGGGDDGAAGDVEALVGVAASAG